MHTKKRRLISYTILYLFLAAGIWGWFVTAEKSLICSSDAYTQHINALMAYGKWMRGILWRLFHEHRFVIENYSFGIGYGGDFMTAMQYYAVGDPLHLPVLFLPTSAVYTYYQFLILLRPYLAGLSFLALAGYHTDRMRASAPATSGKSGVTGMALLAGALSYAFSGTVLFIGMWNPFFVQPMILFPLLILGVDRVLAGENARLYTLAVFLAAVSNFYFCYMMALLTLLYATVRIHAVPKVSVGEASGKENTRGLRPMQAWKKLIGFALWGLALGAVILLPVALAFASNPRTGLKGHALNFLYEPAYYPELLRNLVSYIYHPRYDTEIGLTPVILPVLVCFVIRVAHGKKTCSENDTQTFLRYRFDHTCFILLLLMTLMLLFPAAGYVMNGFSYMINRWCWALTLLLCVLITACWDDLAAWICKRLPAGEKSAHGGAKREMAVSFGLFFLTLAMILYNGVLANAPSKGNLPNGFVERTTGEAFVASYESTEVKALQETMPQTKEAFYRYSGRNLVWNTRLTRGVSSTQFYFSLANGAVADFLREMAVNEMADYSYFGLDERMALLSLTGVNYYTLRYDTPQERQYVPGGFVRAGDYYNFAIYASAFAAPFGQLYTRAIPETDYEQMTPWLKQMMLLHGVVSAGAQEHLTTISDWDDVATAAEPLPYKEVPFTLTTDNRVTRLSEDDANGYLFEVREAGAVCTLLTKGVPESETCLALTGLTTSGTADMVNLQISGYRTDAKESAPSTVKTLSYKSPVSQFYSGWHDYLVNLGYAQSAVERIEIVFPEAGIYAVHSMQVIAQPVQALLTGMAERAAQGMRDV